MSDSSESLSSSSPDSVMSSVIIKFVFSFFFLYGGCTSSSLSVSAVIRKSVIK